MLRLIALACACVISFIEPATAQTCESRTYVSDQEARAFTESDGKLGLTLTGSSYTWDNGTRSGALEIKRAPQGHKLAESVSIVGAGCKRFESAEGLSRYLSAQPAGTTVALDVVSKNGGQVRTVNFRLLPPLTAEYCRKQKIASEARAVQAGMTAGDTTRLVAGGLASTGCAVFLTWMAFDFGLSAATCSLVGIIAADQASRNAAANAAVDSLNEHDDPRCRETYR
jgi:hypothetical protein